MVAMAATLTGISPAAGQTRRSASRADPSNLTTSGHRASVHGLEMYYETAASYRRGEPPLVLLHGALSTIDTDFGKVLARLAATRRIIAIEQQGHGHTADINRPLSYEQMADDTADLLAQLGVSNADFFGYSMGGGIAMYLAIRHPTLVRKIIFAGGSAYDPSGFYPELAEGEKNLTADALKGTPFERVYAYSAPRPADWPALVEKVKQLDLSWKGIPAADLKAITVPVLLIIGDADVVRPEHTVEMFRLLGGGVPGDLHGLPRAQLAVLPGTTHLTLVERADWLVSMATAFLRTSSPATSPTHR